MHCTHTLCGCCPLTPSKDIQRRLPNLLLTFILPHFMHVSPYPVCPVGAQVHALYRCEPPHIVEECVCITRVVTSNIQLVSGCMPADRQRPTLRRCGGDALRHAAVLQQSTRGMVDTSQAGLLAHSKCVCGHSINKVQGQPG